MRISFQKHLLHLKYNHLLFKKSLYYQAVSVLYTDYYHNQQHLFCLNTLPNNRAFGLLEILAIFLLLFL